MGCTFWNSLLKYFGARQQIINGELGQNKYWLPWRFFLMKIHFHFCTGFYSDSVSWTESPWRMEHINFPLWDVQSPNSEFLNSTQLFSVALFPLSYNLCPKKINFSYKLITLLACVAICIHLKRQICLKRSCPPQNQAYFLVLEQI